MRLPGLGVVGKAGEGEDDAPAGTGSQYSLKNFLICGRSRPMVMQQCLKPMLVLSIGHAAEVEGSSPSLTTKINGVTTAQAWHFADCMAHI